MTVGNCVCIENKYVTLLWLTGLEISFQYLVFGGATLSVTGIFRVFLLEPRLECHIILFAEKLSLRSSDLISSECHFDTLEHLK